MPEGSMGHDAYIDALCEQDARRAEKDLAYAILGDRFASNVWTTKDGNTVKLEDMTTSHIGNSIRLIERAIDPSKTVFGFGDRWLGKLYKELKRRGE